MKRILPFLLIVLFWSCNDSSINQKDLHHLNGYWEISEVEFPDGSIKEYGMNTSIDFIQLQEDKGYRKKMKPQFDGSYDTSKDVETFTISKANETIILQYSTELSEWEEKLVQLDSVSFAVTTQEGVTYKYKRFEPIKIPQ
jgi:phage anti-repressor protein